MNTFQLLGCAFLLFTISSCSVRKAERNEASKKNPSSNMSAHSCQATSQAASHAAISTKAKAGKFSGCFANYLRLNKIDEMSVKICARLAVRADGSVSKAAALGDGEALPNDLRWCLEQELWKMNYSKLQFPVSQKISFPMHFEVRK